MYYGVSPESFSGQSTINNSIMRSTYWYTIGLIALVLIGGAFWFVYQVDTDRVSPTVEDAQEHNVSEEYKTYHNEEYGFSFEYPSDWEVRTSIFHSAVSLFNIAVEPSTKKNPEAVLINLTPKEWIENALVKMRRRGVVTRDVIVSDFSALQMDDRDGLGRPATNTLVLVDDTFWIDITGIKTHDAVYRQILESFMIESKL